MRLAQPLAVTLALAMSALRAPAQAPGAVAPCAPAGAVRFLCGIDAAEDSAPIPGTRWLLTGGLGFGRAGAIRLVDVDGGAVRTLYPDPAADRPDRAAYRDCPGPPRADVFSTDGVALRSLGRARHLLYAVNHGGREAVEVFAVDARAAVPSLAWIGCIVLPEHTNPNAVAPVGRDGVVVASMDDGAADRMARHAAGVASGSVFVWQPATGLRRLATPPLHGGNGIVASADGLWLYVSEWSGGAIVRLRTDGTTPPSAVALDYLPDNLKWSARGTLLVAGQRPPVATIASCTGNPCMDDWLIAEVDPRALTSRTLFEAKGTPEVNYATGAVELDGNLYVTNRGASRIAVIRVDERRRRR